MLRGHDELNEHYNTDWNHGQIDTILDHLRYCILSDQFTILKGETTREENRRFIEDYNLNKSRRKELLLGIVSEDFCYSLTSTNADHFGDTLYVFCPIVTLLDPFGDEETLKVLVKFDIMETAEGRFIVVISFHKPHRPIEYLFK